MTVLPPSSLNRQGVPLLNSKTESNQTAQSVTKYQAKSIKTSSVATNPSRVVDSKPYPHNLHPNAASLTVTNENVELFSKRYTPRCELAKCAIDQMKVLQLNALDLTRAMGYPPQHTVAAKERLRTVLNSPYLGLDGCFIDAYYDANEFLYKLCGLLGIDQTYCQTEVAKILNELG